MIFWSFFETITCPKVNFPSLNHYFNNKLSLFHTEVSFDKQEEKQLSYSLNWHFSKFFLWFHEPHNQLNCRLKDWIISKLLTIKNVEYRIVTFLPTQSLVRLSNICFDQYLRLKGSSVFFFIFLHPNKLLTNQINSRFGIENLEFGETMSWTYVLRWALK
jgi:hypothetical protein